MRNQDLSKRVVDLHVCWACVGSTANQQSSSTLENATTHQSLNKRTLYALDLTTYYSNQHWACRIPYSTGRARAFRSCARVAQLFRRQCVWVKTLQAWHSSAGSKTLWVTHLLHGWPIVPTLRTYSSTSDLTPHTHASDSNHGRMRFEPYTQATPQVNNRKGHNISEFPSQGYPVGFFLWERGSRTSGWISIMAELRRADSPNAPLTGLWLRARKRCPSCACALYLRVCCVSHANQG